MFEGDKLIAKVPLSWKKSFCYGVVIAHKMRKCTNCEKDILCDNCDNLVNQKKFSANVNEIKSQPPSDCGYMLPKYITT